MLVCESYKDWPEASKPSCVAIGNFDGVHHGHRVILDRALDVAKQQGLTPTVLTFDPHPTRLFRPENAPRLIEPLSQRLERLETLGFEQVLVQRFDHEFAALSAEDFISLVLHRGLNAKHVAVGLDFRFGKSRTGDTSVLRHAMEAIGGGAEIMPELRAEDSQIVSSTLIRQSIQAGEMLKATKLLGRAPQWQGEIVRGDGRGKGLGFATANLKYLNEVEPALGVYAGIASLQSKRYGCVVNVGINPTFENAGPVKFEAHLFNYDGPDCYGEMFRVQLVKRIREERKFEKLEDLIAQVHADADQAKEILKALDTTLRVS
jgi:riboflavin kinase/FMN adenylyltransferase